MKTVTFLMLGLVSLTGFAADETNSVEVNELEIQAVLLDELAQAEPEQGEPAPVQAEEQESPVAAEPVIDVQGDIVIQTAIGTTANAYIRGPMDSPWGILILHDRWGVNKTIKQWVERFAEKGYRAMTIDVFDGRISKTRRLADEILHATDPETVKVNIQAALDFLQAPGRKVATLGAGFGGWQSFEVSVNSPKDVAATVVLYGKMDGTLNEYRALSAPVMAIFAGGDERITWEMIEDYRVKMRKSFIDYRPETLNADYGFMDPSYRSYAPALAEPVWNEIDSFLSAFVETDQG